MSVITKASMLSLLNNPQPGFRNKVIGRALVRIFEFQTHSEKLHNNVDSNNGVGFSSCDGKQGSIGAKTFIKRGELLDFQVDKWMRPDCTGYPAICRYAGQLNRIVNNCN